MVQTAHTGSFGPLMRSFAVIEGSLIHVRFSFWLLSVKAFHPSPKVVEFRCKTCYDRLQSVPHKIPSFLFWEALD